MSEQGFLGTCERLLDAIEDAVEQAADATGVDADSNRSGQVLEIEFDDGSTIVVNGQAALREIWLASRSGAHHFRASGDDWIDTRSGDTLAATLSRCFSEHAGVPVVLKLG